MTTVFATATAPAPAAAPVGAEVEEVRGRVRAYLTSSLGQPVGDDLDVFAAGLANSLFAAQLVMFVEDAFAVTVEDDELEISSFASVDAVTAFVVGKSAAPARS